MKKYVYIVGELGPEHNSIHSVHASYSGAKKAWEELRERLVSDAKIIDGSFVKNTKEERM